jgi:ABC-2 type transport system permease protein
MLPVVTFARIDIKRLFRDKAAIFWVFVFPLIFLTIFGSIFGGETEVSFRVGLLNQSKTEFATQFEQQLKDNEIFEIDKDVTNVEKS